MIARIVIPLLLVIVLSDVYIDAHYFRKRVHITWQQRLAWWIPTIFLVVYTCALASIHNFAPTNLTWLNTYLFLLGAFVAPKNHLWYMLARWFIGVQNHCKNTQKLWPYVGFWWLQLPFSWYMCMGLHSVFPKFGCAISPLM